MTGENLAEAFARYGSWITRFVIDGVAYGGAFDALNDPRVKLFGQLFPGVASVLELGSLEGGHTIALTRLTGAETVVGVEGRASNLARARFVAHLLKAEAVEFHQADLEKVALASFGKFDAVFCCGLLYHLPEPWRLLRQCAEVAPRLFLWTHYCDAENADRRENGYAGRMFAEGGPDEPLSGLSLCSFWPTLEALAQMVSEAGFTRFQILGDDRDHPHGPAVSLAGWTAASSLPSA